jgi:hypothetical protein
MQLFAGVGSLEGMRLIKILVTALVAVLAVLTGVFIAAIAAVTGMALFFFRRPRSPSRLAQTVPLPSAAEARRPKASDVDVIDVIATEVPTDRAGR